MKPSVIILTALTGISLQAQAGDIQAGKSLVDKNCYSCHGTEVYTRENRKITSLPGLKKQVRRCELALGLSWFDDQIDNATAYLNDGYYKFE